MVPRSCGRGVVGCVQSGRCGYLGSVVAEVSHVRDFLVFFFALPASGGRWSVVGVVVLASDGGKGGRSLAVVWYVFP